MKYFKIFMKFLNISKWSHVKQPWRMHAILMTATVCEQTEYWDWRILNDIEIALRISGIAVVFDSQ